MKQRRLGIFFVGVALCVLIPIAASGASRIFSARVVNHHSTFSSGVLVLGESQGGEGGACQGSCASGSALINLSSLEPGSTITDCIEVGWYSTNTVSSVTLTPTIASGTSLASDLLIVTAQRNSLSGAPFSIPKSPHGANPGCANYPSGGANVSIPATGSHLPGATTPLFNWASGTTYGVSLNNWTWYRFSVSLPLSKSSCSLYCGLSTTLRLTFTATAG